METLAIIAPAKVSISNDKIYTHFSFGRIVDELASRFEKVYLCVPGKSDNPNEIFDYLIQSPNIVLINQSFYNGSSDAIKQLPSIVKAYYQACSRGRNVFVRGMLPYAGLFYLIAWSKSCKVCHWIIGNPVALLKSHVRAGKIKDFFSLLYAWQDRLLTIYGRKLTNGSFICNGDELGNIYKSPRTVVTVSTTLLEDEFFVREDTCRNETIRLLYIGFIRPEKGIEYLLEAVGMLRLEKNWKLTIAGPSEQFPAYKQKLLAIAQQNKIADKIEWPGYVSYGPEMFGYMRQSDIFVLPTLSEGTPRVLVEARANSLPIVSTNVGGIPTSVQNGWDGLLVNSKDSRALADAIEQIVYNPQLRQSLIRNGLTSARKLTVPCFADLVCRQFQC